MDTLERIEAARTRLEENRAVVLQMREAGPPCAQCKHVGWTEEDSSGRRFPACLHLAYARQSFDAFSGHVDKMPVVTAEDARAPDGLCGPEAVFFENNVLSLPSIGQIGAKAFKYTVYVFALGGALEFADFLWPAWF